LPRGYRSLGTRARAAAAGSTVGSTASRRRFSGEVDVYWRFHDDVSLDRWIVTSDSDHAEGFSKCDLKIGRQGYGVFSGHLCSKVPKDGKIQNSGYCNILTKRVAVTTAFLLSIQSVVGYRLF